jgi:hypothetical protein
MGKIALIQPLFVDIVIDIAGIMSRIVSKFSMDFRLIFRALFQTRIMRVRSPSSHIGLALVRESAEDISSTSRIP